jgi:hypothetical protein
MPQGEGEIMSDKIKIDSVPQVGDKGSVAVKHLQISLNEKGAKLVVDGDYGPKTKEAVSSFQKSINLPGSGIVGPLTLAALDLEVALTDIKDKAKAPWFWVAKKFEGKHESNKEFQEKLGGMWGKAGLPQFKGLVGSARAWCALFVLSNLAWGGVSYKGGNASAISWDNFGHDINWKVDGFPQGAVVRLNGGGNCKTTSGNHVTFANGDCSGMDLNKEGATFSGYGGNQGNMAKVSSYSVSKICSVSWPSAQADGTPVAKPAPVLISKNCSNGKTDSEESTR